MIKNNLKYFEELKVFDLRSKNGDKIGNAIRDAECEAIFNKAPYLRNLKELYLVCNREKIRIGCRLTNKSVFVIVKNSEYLKNLTALGLWGNYS